MDTLRGRYRVHHFPPRHSLKASELLPPGLPAADYQRQLMDGFQEGMSKGFEQGMVEGQEQGYQEGFQKGQEDGYREGYASGSLAGQQEGQVKFTQAAQPIEEMFNRANDYLAHIQRKQREDLLQLVEKVTRQVIRCELALQPTQLLALVEEAIAAIPATPDSLHVYLSTEEFNRIQNVAPDKVKEWGLAPSAELPAGECRIVTDTSELDVGCEHRLEQCMDKLKETLSPEAKNE
ncbi:flagellar assembly protein H [Enterobacteriaceae bacterium H16N7]|nr:flagellar assembly protein H [Dryocola clanedunensis]